MPCTCLPAPLRALRLLLIGLSLTAYANDLQLPERGPVVLTDGNIESVMAKSELVFVAFVAEWCHFSRMLTPVWQNTAKELSKQWGEDRLTLGIVQTDKGGASLGQKYSVNKYPTMKLFRRGTVSKREYRGQRSVEAFKQYLEDQMRSPIVEFQKNEHFMNGSPKDGVPRMNRFAEGNVVGYFEDKYSNAYQAFEALAGNLKDDCKFWAGIGEGTKEERISGDNIVFKPKGASNADQVFMGDITNSNLVMNWVHDKCVPLVREITFQNGEELTEEGKPFMILFHKKEDSRSLEEYTKAIEREILDERSKVNFLHADCQQFSHPLFHLGKSVNDCPVIAIDSFKHMYNFPNYKNIHQPGKLKQFVADLHSGKLHREFHDGPDPTTAVPEIASDEPLSEEETKVVVEVVKRDAGEDPEKADLKIVKVKKETPEEVQQKAKDANEGGAPIESQFKRLKPSDLKYSFDPTKKRDEL